MHVCPAGFGSSSVHHKPREEYWSGGPHDGRILRAEQRYCGGVAPQWNAFWQSTKEQQGAVPYCIAEDGTIQSYSYREFAQRFPHPGWVEHDPVDIWDCVVGCVRDVLGHAPRPTIASIGISNQRETVVAWDADTSEPLHNAIVWRAGVPPKDVRS
jgi:hypothetical protein